jgi:hypothetical protein
VKERKDAAFEFVSKYDFNSRREDGVSMCEIAPSIIQFTMLRDRFLRIILYIVRGKQMVLR